MNHLRAVTIERQDICQTGTQFIKNRYLTATTFVHHRHAHPISESSTTIHEDGVNILDTGVVTDMIIGYIIMDVIEVAVVAYLAVMQRSMIDTRMDLQSTRQRYLTRKNTQLVMPRESSITHELRVERFGYFHLRPVLSCTPLCLQLRNLRTRQ